MYLRKRSWLSERLGGIKCPFSSPYFNGDSDWILSPLYKYQDMKTPSVDLGLRIIYDINLENTISF
jgi:hypothetical protein